MKILGEYISKRRFTFAIFYTILFVILVISEIVIIKRITTDGQYINPFLIIIILLAWLIPYGYIGDRIKRKLLISEGVITNIEEDIFQNEQLFQYNRKNTTYIVVVCVISFVIGVIMIPYSVINELYYLLIIGSTLALVPLLIMGLLVIERDRKMGDKDNQGSDEIST